MASSNGGQAPPGSNSGGGRSYHHHHVHTHYPEPYELSQDLIAKQLEVLEKKYGGSTKAKEAALTIQRAFRRSVLFFLNFKFSRFSHKKNV